MTFSVTCTSGREVLAVLLFSVILASLMAATVVLAMAAAALAEAEETVAMPASVAAVEVLPTAALMQVAALAVPVEADRWLCNIQTTMGLLTLRCLQTEHRTLFQAMFARLRFGPLAVVEAAEALALRTPTVRWQPVAVAELVLLTNVLESVRTNWTVYRCITQIQTG
tara:strand:- start:145 stop:648 length:504 start_codon:yes stop_codon:yes gene_type:complete